MKVRFFAIIFSMILAAPAFATVTVTSPWNGETVGSSVQFVASANTSTCSQGVASMGIYVDNQPGLCRQWDQPEHDSDSGAREVTTSWSKSGTTAEARPPLR